MAEETKKEEVKEEKKAKKEKPIEEMTVKELREIAREIPGVTGISGMKKDELLEAIKKAKEEEAKKEETKKEEAREEIAEEEEAKEEEEKEEKVAEEKEKPLDKMTAKELREIAREIPGVTGVSAMKKEQLLEAIKKARGIKEEAPVKKRKRLAAEKEAGIRELKQKIIFLKQEKEAAHKAKERKKVDILRRRINRLKKRTRKAAQAA